MHEIVIFIAKYLFIVSLIGSFVVWLKLSRREKKEFIILALASGLLALALAKLGSWIFYNPRPFVVGHFAPYFPHGNDNGFPSDHTLLTSFLAFVVIKYNRTAGYWLLLVAILVGISRVIAGVHHLVDIIGSIIFSAVAVYVVNKALIHLKITKS